MQYARALWDLARSREARRDLRSAMAQAVRTRSEDQARTPTERWNKEWFRYLEREWEVQLTPYTAYPDKPPLPDDPEAMLSLTLGHGPPLSLFCERAAIENRRVLEVGCGCANLGKLVARYAESYLGVDYSTLALKIAGLVSPANCRFVHYFDRRGIEPFLGTIDSAIGRYFWIHQNMEKAKELIAFIVPLLKTEGRIHADFFWAEPKDRHARVRTPDAPVSEKEPSTTFAYTREDVDALILGSGLRVVRENVHRAMQRRYVVLEKSA